MSIIRGIIPRFRYAGTKRKLWNPVSKKAVEILPEERIRLQCVGFLNETAGISFSKMKTELPVYFERNNSPLRADILTYDANFNPFLLVECKAPHIRLNEKAAIQTARYNHKVSAQYIWITNGITDFFYDVSREKFCSDSDIFDYQPKPFSKETLSESGFCIRDTDPHLRNLLQDFVQLNTLIYINIKSPNPVLEDLRHYYNLSETNNGKLAYTFIAGPDGQNYLVGMWSTPESGDSLLIIKLYKTFAQKVYIYTQRNDSIITDASLEIEDNQAFSLSKNVNWQEYFERLYHLFQ